MTMALQKAPELMQILIEWKSSDHDLVKCGGVMECSHPPFAVDKGSRGGKRGSRGWTHQGPTHTSNI